MRALRVPSIPSARRPARGRPALARFGRLDAERELGQRLANELVRGGNAPVWRALWPQFVAERSGNEERAADAVVVARSVAPQQGPTSRLLRGFYEGLASSGVPAVGVETSGAFVTAVDAFDKASLSSVDFVETGVGRLALTLLLAGGRPGSYGLKATATDGILPPIDPVTPRRCQRAVTETPTILIAARDEEARIAETIAPLRRELPDAAVVVADDGSDGLHSWPSAPGAQVVRLPRRGKDRRSRSQRRRRRRGRCCSVMRTCEERWRRCSPRAPTSRWRRLPSGAAAASGSRSRRSRALIRMRTGFAPREPLSGQRALSERARRASFPLAAGFGCEVAHDDRRAERRAHDPRGGVPLGHRATGRDLAGFAHRRGSCSMRCSPLGPQGVNHRGLRLPLVGWSLGLAGGPAAAAIAATGLADDLWSGPERGLLAHLRARRTTGVLKLVAIPAVGLLATRKLSGALLVALAANLWNQLDTKPGRALKAYLLVAGPLRAPLVPAAVLLPCDFAR